MADATVLNFGSQAIRQTILVHRSYQHGLWESQSVALSCWLRVNTVVVESETALGSALQWNPNEDGAREERRPSAARGEASERRNTFKPRLRRPLRASKRWNGLLERVENW